MAERAQVNGIDVRISSKIECSLRLLDVFPELRIANAMCVVGGTTGIYRLGQGRVQELLAHAEELLSHAKTHRLQPENSGLVRAYGALRVQLDRALRREISRGLWATAPSEEMKRRMAPAFARLEVGERALAFADDDDDDGLLVEVVEPFGFHWTRNEEDGAFVDEQGRRCSYAPCYIVVPVDNRNRRYHVAAGQLTREDGEPAHIRLVPPSALPPAMARR